MKREPLLYAGIFGLLAVALGAFGAHGLKPYLDQYSTEVYTKAVAYQFYHTLALLTVAVIQHNGTSALLRWSGRCFAIGILLFSGSLYTLALTGIRELGAVTPFGGLAFICGWACLIIAAVKMR